MNEQKLFLQTSTQLMMLFWLWLLSPALSSRFFGVPYASDLIGRTGTQIKDWSMLKETNVHKLIANIENPCKRMDEVIIMLCENFVEKDINGYYLQKSMLNLTSQAIDLR